MILVLNNRCFEASRGGSLFGNKFCFALVDWGHELRTIRAWSAANVGHFGVANLTLTQRWNQRRMDNFLPQEAHLEREEAVRRVAKVNLIFLLVFKFLCYFSSNNLLCWFMFFLG